MFATINDVKTITGKNAASDLIARAQYVLESYIGKFESEVVNSTDIEIMKRATAYQSAYMLNNEDIVYEQMAASTIGQNDAYTTFKQGDQASPFIAPLAVMICQKLSFVRSRSVTTGKDSITETLPDWSTI